MGKDPTVASIGVSLFPKDGQDESALLTNADHAMYPRQGGGRATYRFFSPEMDAKARERFQIEADLREALARRQCGCSINPRSTAHGEGRRLRGVAALGSRRARLLCPGAFLNVAEETG